MKLNTKLLQLRLHNTGKKLFLMPSFYNHFLKMPTFVSYFDNRMHPLKSFPSEKMFSLPSLRHCLNAFYALKVIFVVYTFGQRKGIKGYLAF